MPRRTASAGKEIATVPKNTTDEAPVKLDDLGEDGPADSTTPLSSDELTGSLEGEDDFLSALLYGPQGSGKTTAAARIVNSLAPNSRALVIRAEAGLKVQALRQHSVDVSRIVPWPRDRQTKLSYESLDALFLRVADDLEKDPGCWGAIIWDSGSEITRMLLDAVLEDATAEARAIQAQARRMGVAVQARGAAGRKPWSTDRDDYNVMTNQMRSLLRRFRYLPCHLIMTALERRDVDEDTGKVHYGPAFTPAFKSDLMGYMDVVARCLVTTDEGIHYAHTRLSDAWEAKDRYGLLPAVMVNPHTDRMMAYVQGALTADTDRTQERLPTDLAEIANKVVAPEDNITDAPPKGKEEAETSTKKPPRRKTETGRKTEPPKVNAGHPDDPPF